MPKPDPKSGKDDDPKDDPDKKDPDPTSEAEKWKSLARKHEAQAKANADAAKKLAELEDADKSELQKAADKAAAADKRAEEAEARALRMEVAAEKGLNAKQAKRLVGTTREELEADAADLLKDFTPTGDGDGGDGGPDKGGKAPERPKERLKGGGAPEDNEPDETDPRKLAESVPRL